MPALAAENFVASCRKATFASCVKFVKVHDGGGVDHVHICPAAPSGTTASLYCSHSLTLISALHTRCRTRSTTHMRTTQRVGHTRRLRGQRSSGANGVLWLRGRDGGSNICTNRNANRRSHELGADERTNSTHDSTNRIANGC
jgi:hypothetical protein